MAFKMSGHALPGPYQKKTKTFTTDDSGGVQKTVTRTNRKGDVKSVKTTDYDASGTRTKKTIKKKHLGTKTIEGRGLDAKVTGYDGTTSTRRENIKKDTKDVVKALAGTAIMTAGGLAGGYGGAIAGYGKGKGIAKGVKTIAGFMAGAQGGASAGQKIAEKLDSRFGMGDGSEFRPLRDSARQIVGGIKDTVKKVKNAPANIKQKIHKKRQSKATK